MKSKQDYLKMLFGEPRAREQNVVLDRIQTTAPILNKNINFNLLVEYLINNKIPPIFSDEKRNGKYVGNAVALEKAYKKMNEKDIIATMPYLIAGKAEADKNNYLWQNWFSCLSEENVGIDTKGNFVKKGNSVVITVHGKGLLTTNPDRIFRAYTAGLTPQNSARYSQNEFEELLNGEIRGNKIQIYTIDDVLKGNIKNPFERYAVVLDFEKTKITNSGQHEKNDFMNNPLVLARAGTIEYLEDYFDKAKDLNGTVGNYHRLSEIDPKEYQGRLLYLIIPMTDLMAIIV
ncbi:MAG: hypothetical protein AB7V77_03975 [Candidatus Woesearchaeota archaeon]